MSLTQLAPPYPIFTDKNGDPLDAGFLYFGVVNQNPETQPIQVYYDSAFTQPAAQPLRTSNGYVMRNGSPALIYAGSEASVTVRDKKGQLVIYSPAGYGFDPLSVSANDITVTDHSGDGVTASFAMDASPATILATTVFVDGLYQEKNTYTISGPTLTFNTPPANGTSIEIVVAQSAEINGAGAQQITYDQGGIGAVQRTVKSRLQDFVSVKDFGAVGDGVTDDTAAIQAAIDAASIVEFPVGSYRLTSSTYDAVADWRHHIIIPDDRTLVFDQQAKVIATTPFASRAIALLVRGSNITIDGAQVEDDFNPGDPYLVGVGSGSTYDSSYPSGTLENLRVVNSTFRNCWLSISIQFASTDGGGKSFNDIQMSCCTSYAKPANTSSGNFNFRSDGPWKVGDVKISDCSAYDGYSASSFNLYGVDGFSVSNCASYRNKYAGCEMENGSQDGVVSCFRSVDDFYGVWVDDSRRIVVDGVSHKTISESVSGLLGTQSRLRDALKVTEEGFTGYTTWETTDIVFSNVVSEFGKITTESFGGSPTGSIGKLSFNNVSIVQDGVSRASGNNAVSVLKVPTHITFNNVQVFGAPAVSFNMSTTGGKVSLSNVTTGTVAGETSIGIQAIGTGTLVLENVDTHSENITVAPTPTKINYTLAGVVQADVRKQQRFFYSVTGSPEGVLTAGPGSLAHRVDLGALYVKGSGTGNTGWLIVTAT
jgi:hypothetical protein